MRAHVCARLFLLRAVPFNIVHGSGVTAKKFGLEGEGCQLEIYVEKTTGGRGVISRNLNMIIQKMSKI